MYESRGDIYTLADYTPVLQIHNAYLLKLVVINDVPLSKWISTDFPRYYELRSIVSSTFWFMGFLGASGWF